MSHGVLLRMVAFLCVLSFGGALVVALTPGPTVAKVGAYLARAAVVIAVRLALWGTRD